MRVYENDENDDDDNDEADYNNIRIARPLLRKSLMLKEEKCENISNYILSDCVTEKFSYYMRAHTHKQTHTYTLHTHTHTQIYVYI